MVEWQDGRIADLTRGQRENTLSSTNFYTKILHGYQEIAFKATKDILTGKLVLRPFNLCLLLLLLWAPDLHCEKK